MKPDMLDLVTKLERLSDSPNLAAYKYILKEAVVRLVAMDGQIIKLQGKVDQPKER